VPTNIRKRGPPKVPERRRWSPRTFDGSLRWPAFIFAPSLEGMHWCECLTRRPHRLRRGSGRPGGVIGGYTAPGLRRTSHPSNERAKRRDHLPECALEMNVAVSPLVIPSLVPYRET
jgi:hypothetical protein